MASRRLMAALAAALAGGGAAGVAAGRQDDETFAGAAGRMGRSALSGTQQGLLAGYADEIMGEDSRHGEFRDAAPVSFAAGEAAGAVVPGLAGFETVRRLMQGRGSARSRLMIAALAGAAHGGLAGSGQGEKEDVTGEQRLQGAAMGAGIGGAVGAASVPVARAVGDLADNLPALLGRRQLAEGGVEQVSLGRGTRRSAPLNVSLRGEGTPQQRAQAALRAAMARDEAMASQRGGVTMGRFADQPGGRNVTPFSGPNVGPTMRALVDTAAQTPAAAQRLRAEAAQMMSQAVRTQVRGARSTRGTGKTGLAPADRRDFIAAFNMPEAHRGFLQAVSKLTKMQKQQVAEEILQDLRRQAQQIGADEIDALAQLLRNRDVLARLEALGVRFSAVGRNRMAPIDDPDVISRINQLRSRADGRPGAFDDLQGEDAALARAGTLREEDALALIAEARRPQRALFVSPDRTARAFSGEYEAGARFRPRDWGNVGAEDLERAIVASQPATALALAPSHTRPRRRRGQ